MDIPSVTYKSYNFCCFPVHPLTSGEGVVSPSLLIFTKRAAVVQTGTFPALGYPGVMVLATFPSHFKRVALAQVTLLPPKSPTQGQCSLLRAVHQVPSQAWGWQTERNSALSSVSSHREANLPCCLKGEAEYERVEMPRGPEGGIAKDKVWREAWKDQLQLCQGQA